MCLKTNKLIKVSNKVLRENRLMTSQLKLRPRIAISATLTLRTETSSSSWDRPPRPIFIITDHKLLSVDMMGASVHARDARTRGTFRIHEWIDKLRVEEVTFRTGED